LNSPFSDLLLISSASLAFCYVLSVLQPEGPCTSLSLTLPSSTQMLKHPGISAHKVWTDNSHCSAQFFSADSPIASFKLASSSCPPALPVHHPIDVLQFLSLPSHILAHPMLLFLVLIFLINSLPQSLPIPNVSLLLLSLSFHHLYLQNPESN